MGARVTGLDFSSTAIQKDRAVADDAQIDARFIVADAQALPGELQDGFDCVFASYGVLMWIADLGAWMASAAQALRHGGRLVLVEGHPVSLLVRSVDPPVLEGPYQGGDPLHGRWPGDYADPEAVTTNDRAIHFRHGLGEVISAAIASGLRIEALTEWMDESQAPSGKLQVGDDGRAHLRFAGADLLLTYALRAS
jgi:SAM-dependent methyltransferase